jgi:hypothetical protein
MKSPTYAKLRIALFLSWSKETSADPDGWTCENPSWGQCAVTALVVQDFFGGEIFRGSLKEVIGFERMRSHYWNHVEDGERDFSQSQFPADVYKTIPKGETRTREYLLSNPETNRRYEILKQRLQELFQKNV